MPFFLPSSLFWTTLCLLLLQRVALIGAVFKIEEVIVNGIKSRPFNGRPHDPLKVHVGFYLESVGNFRSQEMAFDVDMYIYMSWLDSRLSHNHTNHLLISDRKLRDNIWLPDLYFANARQAHFQDVTVPNFSLFVSREGLVSYSSRATCSISCSLQLTRYPMDRQRCFIRILSYAHTSSEMDVRWFTLDPVRFNPEIGLPEFAITRVDHSYCDGVYRYVLTEHSHKIGNFSCLSGNIFLSRSLGFSLAEAYIPTSLVVMISWVSFWIDRRAVPARVTVSFTTLVSLTTLGSGIRIGLPQVSYAKAIDFWLGACMFFVITALLEYALVNTYTRKAEKLAHQARTLHEAPAKKRRGAFAAKGEHFYSSDEEMAALRIEGLSFPNLSTREYTSSRLRSQPLPPLHTNGANFTPAASPMLKKASTMSLSNNTRDSFSFSTPFLLSNPFTRSKRSRCMMQEGAAPTVLTVTAASYTQASSASSRLALNIDKVCRVAFPFAWCLFNGLYWGYYLVLNNSEPE